MEPDVHSGGILAQPQAPCSQQQQWWGEKEGLGLCVEDKEHPQAPAFWCSGAHRPQGLPHAPGLLTGGA